MFTIVFGLMFVEIQAYFFLSIYEEKYFILLCHLIILLLVRRKLYINIVVYHIKQL